MRRIIYAWDYIEWGGAQIHFLGLMKEARRSFDVVVVLPEKTDAQMLGFLDAEGIRWETFPGHIDAKPRRTALSKIRRHWIRFKTEYSMLRTIEAVGMDAAVHTDIVPGQSLLSLIWLSLRTNVFITLHNAMPPVPKWRWAVWKLKYGIISWFDSFHVFCTNEHAAHYFSELFSRRVANDIKITYDSINPIEVEAARTTSFDRGQVSARLDLPTDKVIVLAVGQFIDRKGRWILFEAAKSIKSQTDECVFVWVTPDLPKNEDAERVRSFGLGDGFYLIKSETIGTTRQDILRFFRIADLFVLPSFVEGVPIALLEAMAMGLPCISTNVYGIPEAIMNEETGLLVEAGDSKGLSEAILRLLRDRQLRTCLGEQGRQLAITKFDERIAARTAISSYNAVLNERS